MKLLTRDDFREATFARTGGRCAVPGCAEPAVDAHHILERRLWDDGGYYLENGAGLCGNHHLAAEMTVISPQQLRDWLGITVVALPPQLPPDYVYDKWGNEVHDDGSRSPGELFWDESVQKVLDRGGMLALFRTHMKYPKTPHLPWSPGVHSDDSVMDDDVVRRLAKRSLVVTEKMDGENTTFYSNYMHARSLDSMSHSSQAYVKSIHARVAPDIPAGWRVVGENMYATHSIKYEDLRGYFVVFAIFDETGTLLPWVEIQDWARLLDLPTVPVIDRGPCQTLRHAEFNWQTYAEKLGRESEGFVVRNEDAIRPEDFRHSVAKYVRAGHVQTIQHGWKYRNDYGVNKLAHA